MTKQKIALDELIAPAFFKVHKAVREESHSEYLLKGGRGSCKSSFVSLEIILGMLRHKDASAIIYRKVADTLRDSVYAQMLWAIEKLGCMAYFQCRLSPMEMIFHPTGQKIVFRGADDPQKSKGIKLAKGHFHYLWFEELTEFDSMEDIRTIKASVIRGGNALTFFTYNPPMSAMNWVNEEALLPKDGRLIHNSHYLQVPSDWLGRDFLNEASALKAQNERAYRHMYLGQITGSGGAVFENLDIRPVPKDEWESFPTYCGLDFGFAKDPDTFVKCAFDKKRRRLFLTEEFVASGQLLEQLAKELKGRVGKEILTCDSADPRSIATLRQKGLMAIAAKKGAGSIDHGIKWLQTLERIVIDPSLCPFSAKEFVRYEYDRDKMGQVIARYPDKDNHAIDAIRYAVESVSTRRTAHAIR